MSNSTQRSLSAQGLRKAYKGLEVVADVDVEVSGGEVVGLLGPNGAGKTTCFYMIVGLIRSDSGIIHLDGTDIGDLPMHERARLGVGYLPQEASVFRKLSVYDNILAILQTRPGLTDRVRRQRTEELMDEFGVSHKRDTLGISLSGGERRRVEIARALAMEPSFILLDEPFAGIDPISVGDIQGIIRHLKSMNIGVLITDHNVRETLGICDRAYILSEGKVLAAGDPDAILNNAAVREVYLGSDFRL